MPDYFPRQTIDWRQIDEPPAFRRLTLSLLETALVTGVVLRLLRALTFTAGRQSWFLYGAAFLLGAVILVGMATAHLANFSLRRWLWRAPAFALLETVGEMVTSLLLIAVHREPEGSVRADFHDWPSMAMRALWQNELAICLWVLLLAAVIVIVRRSGMADGVDKAPADLPLP
jgi:hypothetical protein